MVTVLTVNYNTPEYLERLLSSFRKFYPEIPFLVIDGSDNENYKKIQHFDKKYNVELIHFNYNIHHGPGMNFGINKIETRQILLLDSDMIIHSGGWIEMMQKELRPDSYGIGDIQKEYYLDTKYVDIPPTIKKINASPRTCLRVRRKVIGGGRNAIVDKVWCDYMHPVCALVNKNVIIHYPMPIKGGAPLIEAMRVIWQQGLSGQLLQRAQWLTDDLWNHTKKYVQHNDTHAGMGTVTSTGGYHLDPEEKKQLALAIVISTYQRPDGKTPMYLHKTLTAIDKQTFRNYKVFVIGDAYQNEMELRSIISHHKQCVYFNLANSPERDRYGIGNEKIWCAGGVTAVNTGIKMALSEGFEYICHQAHDDIWRPNHLQTIANMIEKYHPIFCCTMATYFGKHILPGIPEDHSIKPFYPIDGGIAAQTACVKYSDTNLRPMDRLNVEGIMSPCDAYLWQQLREEMQRTGKQGYITATITCHHDEEGYIMRTR